MVPAPVTMLLAFAGGVVMLLSPCTFPLVLGIVPLCKRGQRGRAVGVALLYGLGLTTTLAVWGVVIGALGRVLGFQELAQSFSIAGGVIAYLLGLWTLGLVPFTIPSAMIRIPDSLRDRSQYLGALFMGLLLGNTGLCCPDPVFLSMIPMIAARGAPTYGGLLAAAYGAGRAVPLVAIVLLASAGIDSLRLAARYKESFDRVIGWSLVTVGAFMLYGYSGVSHEVALAVVLIVAAVAAYHVKARSSPWRAMTWTVASGLAMAGGVELLYFVLVRLP